MRFLAFFLLLIPVWVSAQSTITGKVINAADKTPVPYASVFLSNSVVGAKTENDGSFTLSNVKAGQYDMVISFIGFETYHQTVTVAAGSTTLPTISLKPKTTQLKEVTIAPDAFRESNLKVFIEEFLGRSENAQQCRILNTDAITIRYDKATKMLNASSDEFLVIENKALGYTVRYQLNTFIKDYAHNSLYFEGNVLFEEMKGRAGQQKRWLKKRLDTYKGSEMHCLRSIFSDQLAQEGFRPLKLIRKPNLERPPDSLIRANLRKYLFHSNDHPGWKDSAEVWQKKQQLPKIKEYLVTKLMPLNDFVARTDNPTMLALKFTDCLYVIYTKRHDSGNYGNVYHPIDMPEYPTSIITLNHNYAVFDSNGVFTDPTSTTHEGEWGKSRIADLLPVDYDPLTSKP